MKAKEMNIPIISSMGAGNKLDASKFEVADIYKTSVCPLAKVMRRELKKRGVKNLKVVYSKEGTDLKPVRRIWQSPAAQTASVRREQSTSVRSAGPFRQVWHLCRRWYVIKIFS